MWTFLRNHCKSRLTAFGVRMGKLKNNICRVSVRISQLLTCSFLLVFGSLGVGDQCNLQAQTAKDLKKNLYAPGYTPIDLSAYDDEDDPYMPHDSIGRFIYKIEKYFGMDKASKIAKFQSNCDKGFGEFCFKLGEIARRDKNLFIAENYYQLACRYGNTGSCRKHEKALEARLDFEKDLRRKKLD